MEENKIGDIAVPDELAKELAKLRSKDKIYSWLFTGMVSIALITGAWLYTHRDSNASLSGPQAITSETGASNAYFGGANSTGASTDNGSVSGNSAGGGCCGGGQAGAGGTSKEQLTKYEAEALAKEKAQFGDENVTAKASDYGCHIQIDIYNASKKVIHSYAVRGGQMNFVS